MTAKTARRLATAACTGALALAGCSSGSTGEGSESAAPDELREMTLMLNWTPNAHHVGIYAAQANGWFEENGIDLTIIEPVGTGVEQAVSSGAADLGIAQGESLLAARAADVPVQSVATILPVNDSALFGLATDGITRPKDMQGTTYGEYGGAEEKEIISALVSCDGGDPSQVEFVPVGNVDYLVGLQQDQYDTAWVYSGWDALRASEVEGVDIAQIRLADWQECVPNWYTPIFVTEDQLSEAEADLIRDALATIARGYAFAAEDPSAAADALLEQVPELDAALVEASVAYYAPKFTENGEPWGWQDETTWTEFADFLSESGALTQPVDGTEVYTNDYLPTD